MKVSILIPAYNAAEFLEQCVKSVLAQTHQDLQIVIIDDGSSDNTSEIAADLARQDCRIEFLSRPNKGVAATRNELLEMIKGDYFLFVDADDWIEPAMVENLLGMALSENAEIAMCRHISEKPGHISTPLLDDKRIEVWKHNTLIEKFLIHRELTGSLCNKLAKASLLHRVLPVEPGLRPGGVQNVLFDSKVSYGEDALALWQLLPYVSKMAVTRNQYYHYRMNDASISHQRLSKSKCSAITVWDRIVATTPGNYPHWYLLAKSRRGEEIALLLRQAIVDGCDEPAIPRQLCGALKPSVPAMWKAGIAKKSMCLFATVATIFLPVAKLAKKLL